MKHITVAVDSFKGSLTSFQVACAVEKGFKKVFPDCVVNKVSIADGGEGTVDALVQTLAGEYVDVMVADPLMRPIQARYGVIENGKTAVMEMSAASGLPLLLESERNPLKTTTYGTGEMIAHALKHGCRDFLIGIGGSATNDAGVGMLRALGYKFFDRDGKLLHGGGEILEHIAVIDSDNVMPELKEAKFTVACDVTNPLYGPNGAAYIFAPQKGATPKMVEQLDLGLKNFAQVVQRHLGVDISELPGAGAAGGLGGALKAFLGATLERGIEMVLNAMNFRQIISDSELVITGEGRLDKQTVMGKAPSGVMQVASSIGIPTIAIGGAIKDCPELRESGFAAMFPIVAMPTSLESAMEYSVAMDNVERTTEQIAKLIKLGKKLAV
ncbi:MAG: glycerate kinase [Bacteroidales bacterium]|nr:glycerate kinase [Bacteroidales bacterium]